MMDRPYNSVFLVGCPRSGTTLLQSMLASHRQIVSFPETHLFSETVPIQTWKQLMSWYGPHKREAVEKILREFEVNNPTEILPKKLVFSTKRWASFLLAAIDHIALTFDSKPETTHWLEKTPRHLHYIDLIQEAVPESKFIHIIRRGEDVVVSMMEATAQNPEAWEGGRSMKEAIFWWNRAIKISERYLGKSHHFFVSYEELLQSPREMLNALSTFLGIPFSRSMITAFAASSLFLIGYIIHHTVHGDTRFLTEGWLRPVYFFILVSHIILSIAVLPLVLTTFYFAACRRWSAHKALARWTYPIWLYVSVTGILVFLFLRYLNAA